MNRSAGISTAGAVVALLVTGQVANAAMMTAVGPGEGQVDIVAWAGYIERGETDKAYDWVTDFEKQTGCKVNVKIAGTSDEMVTLMNDGGFDLVTASGDASLRLIAGKHGPGDQHRPDPQLEERRPAPAERALAHGRRQALRRALPVGPERADVQHRRLQGQAPKSWSVVFDEQTLPDGKSNKGRVQAYNGAIYIADAALYLMKTKPELGIKDPYELNEDQYKAVLDLLREQKPLVQRYWHDATVQIDDFKNEGVVASGSWPYQVNLLAGQQGSRSPRSIPAEGATGWADTTMMHVEGAAPELRLHVDGAFARAQGAGRRRRLVRLGAGGAGRLQGQRAPDRRGLRAPTASTTSTRSPSGRRRSASARRRRPACPIHAG